MDLLARRKTKQEVVVIGHLVMQMKMTDNLQLEIKNMKDIQILKAVMSSNRKRPRNSLIIRQLRVWRKNTF
jgi:hypothetical protein